MLTAAVTALLSGPAMAQDFTDITTKVTQQIKTSTADNGSPGDILIESTGSVVVATAGPAVEIDSANSLTNQGTISNIGTTDAIGIQLDATPTGNGLTNPTDVAFDSTGTIDLSGDGSNKTAIFIGIPSSDTTDTTGSFTGSINLEAGSTLKATGDQAIGIEIGDGTTYNGNIDVAGSLTLSGGTGMTGILMGSGATDAMPTNMIGNLTVDAGSAFSLTGDNSTGIHMAANSTLTGNLDIEGSISIAPTTATSTTSGQTTGILIDTNTNPTAISGNFTIGTAGSVDVTGQGARGIVLLGGLGGNFTNDGSISAFGAATPVSGTLNPVSGSAIAIGASVGAGILNNGPASSADTTAAANIQANGALPVFLISPAAGGATPAANINIGPNANLGEGLYDFVNRGRIVAAPDNPDQADTSVLRIEGAGFTTSLLDGLFNSGSISGAAGGDDKQLGPMQVSAISIGKGADISVLFNSNENSGAPGNISASYSGTLLGGAAYAIHIEEGATVSSLINQGTIIASAINTDTTIAGTGTVPCQSGSLSACAIWDESGTLTNIQNSGSILASATTLDDNSQSAVAINIAAATTDTTIDNSGTITGDVLLGDAADHVIVHGSTNQAATITGDIAFGGTSMAAGGVDMLEVDDHASVTGQITERAGGLLDVLLNPGAVLTLTNDSIDTESRFLVDNLTVGAGATLGLSLSQTYNLAANPNAGGFVTASGDVMLNPQAILSLPFQGFLSGQTPGEASQFILIDAPLGDLQLDLPALQSQICSTLPFLFESTDLQCLSEVNTTGRSQLQLTLTPKSAEQIGLTGYAATMFPLANLALANDDQLGAAVINAGAPVNGVQLTQAQGQTLYQAVYSQFAPNVTGASRALAIELTDQASGPVGARQRELRMYAGQPGETTLWGQEFNFSLNQDANAGTIGYRDTGFGIVVGVDGGNPSDGRYGGALTFYSGDINEKQPQLSKTNSEWGILSGYTDWRGRGFFFDTQISAGVGQLDGKRTISVGGVTRTADGKRDALLGAIGMTTGVILTTGSTVFTPLVSLDGMAMRENGYSEHGGGDPNGGDAFDLNVQNTYYDSARGFVGADLRQDINLGDIYLQPEARAGYRYDFLSDATKLKASFASTPGTGFTLTGPDPDKGNIVLGGSLATTTGAWSIGVNYDYLRGNNGSISQVGTLTLVGRI
jgi:hypothetical protein